MGLRVLMATNEAVRPGIGTTGSVLKRFAERGSGPWKSDVSGLRGIDSARDAAQTGPLFYTRLLLAAAFLIPVTLVVAVHAQSSSTTVRHHRVADEDPAAAWLSEAEADIDKHDYANAEPLLKKFLEAHPDSYSAWYDLGFVYHSLGRSNDSIAAYRKSVAAKPDVFESNLNLGLALAEAEQPDAEQFLRTAAKLKPASNPTEGRKRAWMALARFLQAAKPDEAVSALHEASAVDPKDAEPHLMAGSLLEKLQRPSDA